MILKLRLLKIPNEIIIESETYNLKSQKLDEVRCQMWEKATVTLPQKT